MERKYSLNSNYLPVYNWEFIPYDPDIETYIDLPYCNKKNVPIKGKQSRRSR